ncbi:hypothetical protein PORY_001118 [Pneumocystis oryctolagi]|uniref:Uncharacterized protein n=1 Tax=Pneumocystis oryctolagi TaxID=42067 RepID=A0ACB7CG78_9ASCO|nr:hypothetical protein PORY_001118 [Pneumocystis oryctolagi]
MEEIETCIYEKQQRMEEERLLEMNNGNDSDSSLTEDPFGEDVESVDLPMEEKMNTQETEWERMQEVLKEEQLNTFDYDHSRIKRIKRNTHTAMSSQLEASIKKEERENKKAEKMARKEEKEKERALKIFLKEEKRRLKEMKKKEEERKREERRIEKETQKREEMNKREEEKFRKEKEKQLKKEERLKKKAEKDSKQLEKLEAEKKQNSQLKLQNFFHSTLPKENRTEIKDCFVSDYEKCFIPFFVKQHTFLSKQHAFVRNLDDHIAAIKNIDTFLDSDFPITSPIKHLLSLFKITVSPFSRPRQPGITIKSILQKYDQSDSTNDLLNKLKAFPMKLLQFREDVRPPYYGTFSKSSSILTPRNPFKMDELLFNYHYDSEAEWIEEEEGEDIDSITDSDEEEDASMLKEEEDDKNFLDDDDECTDTKKKVFVNLIPSVKGIYWQDSNNIDEDDYNSFKKLKMEVLIDTNLPINPYQDYWSSNTHSDNDSVSRNPVSKTASSAIMSPKTLYFPQDLLPSFLKIIQGSTQTKVLLVETLRRKFTDVSKQAIQWKLSTVARRNGKGINDTWAVDPSIWHSVFGKDQDS